jgi:hypothetical protein
VTTDFRTLLAEASMKTLHAPQLGRVFPGISIEKNNLLGVLQA